MKSRHLLVIALALLFSLLPLGSALAKGIVRVTITGPGLDGARELTPNAAAEGLMPLFTDQISPPNGLGADYYTIREEMGFESEVFAANVYHYYPDPQGGDGYIFYADVENGLSGSEGGWFRINPAVEQIIADVIAQAAFSPQDCARAAGLGSYPLCWKMAVLHL
jgi:hypothetical protein